MVFVEKLFTRIPFYTIPSSQVLAGYVRFGFQIVWLFPFFLILLAMYRHDDISPGARLKEKLIFNREYDFIVVGAGSGGAVMANRLTEMPDWSTLLIEAGTDGNFLTDIPAFASINQLTYYDWKYQTEPQERACLGFNDRRCNWPRGKVLGGSSVLNYMLYVRGNPRDYDNWAAAGNTGWGWDQVLPYFLKSEDQRNPEYAMDRKYHSTGGYLTIETPGYRTELVDAFLEGAVELGYKVGDINGPTQTLFTHPQGTLRDGARCSTEKAFLRPARDRPNLHLAKKSTVMQILINPETKKAYGVKFIRFGKIHTITAKKEVILCAGAINSPQLLMLSGVGPRSHLESLGINVIKELPVGDNLQDHIAVGGLLFTIDKPITIKEGRLLKLNNILNYTLHRNGPFTVLGAVEGLAWLNTKYANPALDFPDMEFHYVSGSPTSDGGTSVRNNYNIRDDVWRKFYDPVNRMEVFSINPTLLRPKSRGTIRLRNTNPFEPPIIDPRYLTEDIDAKILVEGVKLAVQLTQTNAYKRFNTQLYTTPYPGCEAIPFASDEYWDCLVRQMTVTFYHFSCTCKMGPSTDPTAVVSPQLLVHGIENLRVVDASVFPDVVSGNTNAPVIMIAEKAADMVKDKWLGQTKRNMKLGENEIDSSPFHNDTLGS